MATILTDARRRGWFWMENVVVDEGWVAKMGPHTNAVYTILVRCSDSQGVAFPSHDYLAEKSGVSIRHIPRCIGRLIHLGLIKKTKQGGARRGSNIYRLLPLVGVVIPDREESETHEDGSGSTKTRAPGVRDPLEPFVFQRAWDAYPRKVGVSKPASIRAWNARIKEGTSAEAMAMGVERYALYCRAMKVEQRFMKLPATFFGPDQHWVNDWTPPEEQEFDRSGRGKVEEKPDLLSYYQQEEIV